MAAKNLRGVIREMEKKFPGLAARWKKKPPSQSTASCTRSTFSAPIKPGAEVFFIPKIEGG